MKLSSIPNWITSLRLAGCPLLIALFVMGSYKALLVTYAMMELLDQVDGKLAKVMKWQTEVGKFFDPFVDSLTHLIALACLMNVGLVPLWMYAVFLFREFGLLFLRLLAALQGVSLGGHWAGKAKATVHAVVIFVCLWRLTFQSDVVFKASAWLWMALTASIASGIFYLYRYGFVLRKAFQHETGSRH